MLDEGVDLDTFIYNELFKEDRNLAFQWSENSPIIASRGLGNDMVRLNAYISEVLIRQFNGTPTEVSKILFTIDQEKYVKRVKEVLVPTMLKHKVKFKIE